MGGGKASPSKERCPFIRGVHVGGSVLKYSWRLFSGEAAMRRSLFLVNKKVFTGRIDDSVGRAPGFN